MGEVKGDGGAGGPELMASLYDGGISQTGGVNSGAEG